MPKRGLDAEEEGGEPLERAESADRYRQPSACWSGVIDSEDLLPVVFKFLDIAERARASRVCKAWQRAAANKLTESTSLSLRVLIADTTRRVVERRPPWASADVPRTSAEREEERLEAAKQLGSFVLMAGEAAEVLRSPRCGGLRRLRLELVAAASSHDLGPDLRTIADALQASAAPLSALALAVPSGARLRGWWRVLHPLLPPLELARAAPLLEELDHSDGGGVDLATLGLAHPSLRRLVARVVVHPFSDLEPALRRVPCLEGLSSVEVKYPAGYSQPLDASAALAAAGVRTRQLQIKDGPVSGAHARLLGPGAALRLTRCTFPATDAWTLDPPAGLAELVLEDCSIPDALLELLFARRGGSEARLLRPGAFLQLSRCTFPARQDWAVDLPPGLAELAVLGCDVPFALLELLLTRTSECAPGLGKLVVSFRLDRPSAQGVISALERATGGTQIELDWPVGDDEWSAPAVVAPLARALSSSPALARFAHVPLPLRLVHSLPPEAAADFAEYRRARAAALREMGEAGGRLLAAQGYNRE